MFSSLLRRTTTVLVGNGLSKAILMGFEFYLAVSLGAAEYGYFSISLAFLLLVSNLTLFGLNYGVVQYLAIYQEEQREDKIRALVQCSLVVVGLASSSVGLLTATGSRLLAYDVFNKAELANALVVVGLAIPFEALNQVLSAVFRGFRQFKFHIIVSDLIRNTSLLLSIPLILTFDLKAIQVLYFLLAGSVLGTCFGLCRVWVWVIPLDVFDLEGWSVLKEAVAFSYLLFAWNVFQKIAGRSQMLLGGIFLTSEQAGVLAMFLRLILIFTFLQSAVNHTVLVEFAMLDHLGEKERLKRFFGSTAETLLIISILLSLPMVANPDALFGILGEEYVPYAWWILPLVGAQVINVGTGPIGQLLIGCKKLGSILFATVIGSVVEIGLSILLMPAYGVAGAVIAHSLTILTLTSLRHLISWKSLGIHFFSLNFFALFLGGVFSVLIGFYCRSVVVDDLSAWLLGIIVSVISYILFLMAYFFLDEKFKERVLYYAAQVGKAKWAL